MKPIKNILEIDPFVLLIMTEEEQYNLLENNGIIQELQDKTICHKCNEIIDSGLLESLSDLAKRLWEEALKYGTRGIDEAILKVWRIVTGNELTGIGVSVYMDYCKIACEWFRYYSPSNPIVTIVVSLTAIQMVEQKEENEN